jgi:hypothetical protein
MSRWTCPQSAREFGRVSIATSRIAHGVKLYRVEDLDADVRSWLTEAFLFASVLS